MDKSADSGAPWTRGPSQVSVLALGVPTSMWAQRAHLPRRNRGARRALSRARPDPGHEGPGPLEPRPTHHGTGDSLGLRGPGRCLSPPVPGQAGTEQGSETVSQAPVHNLQGSPRPQERPMGCEDQTGREQA